MTTTTPAVPVFLDCDTGIDDALALAYLLASPSADLIGIGTVSGNTDSTTAARNTLGLLRLAGREDIPVSIGAHDFRATAYAGGSPHVHGEDGVGNVALPDTSDLAPIAGTAAEHLVRAARENPGELRVIAIGPLTNLALALELDPDLPSFVHSVTIMGGAAMVPGNVSPVAEANIWHDPEAAAIVLAAGWPVVLVPLDVTMKQLIDEEARDALLSSASPVAVAVGHMLDYYYEFYVLNFGYRTAAMHDPLAVAIALGDITVTLAPNVNVVVDTTDGPGRGQTIVDLRAIYRGFPAEHPSPVSVAITIDGDHGAEIAARVAG